MRAYSSIQHSTVLDGFHTEYVWLENDFLLNKGYCLVFLAVRVSFRKCLPSWVWPYGGVTTVSDEKSARGLPVGTQPSQRPQLGSTSVWAYDILCARLCDHAIPFWSQVAYIKTKYVQLVETCQKSCPLQTLIDTFFAPPPPPSPPPE